MKKELMALIHLSMGFSGSCKGMALDFDREVWNNIVDKCVECGYDAIVLDVSDGMKYKSHPEIADPDAWTREEMTAEIHRLRDMGLKLYPKVNFSGMHDYWIKDYRKIRATDEYRAFCKDIIEELYEVFEAPRYIHLGLDEEFPDRADELGFRTGDTLFNDYKFLINVVKDLGSTPMMWASTCMHTPGEWEKHIPEDVIFAAGHYYEFEKEKWTKIADQAPWVQKYYWGGMFERRNLYKKYLERYGNTKIEYVEQDETVQMYMDFLEYISERNYKFYIITSNIFIDTNDRSSVEYYSKWKYKDNILGHFALPWVRTTKVNEAKILAEIETLAKAVKECY